MKKILNQLFDQQQLTETEAYDVLTKIGKNKYNPSETAAFLTVFMMRKIAVQELKGFKDALLDLCKKIDFSDFNTIDLCGTGGDGKDTFNISTLSALVVAGAGYKVAKHGNYGVSSAVGSSSLLEHLGYHFTNNEDILKRQLENSNFCMMHAPLFHPAMKNVAPIRKELGVKTFFNMLGPLVNPSSPKNQLTGVFNLELARIYNYIFQQSNNNYTILHSLDGYDEISLTSPFKLYSNNIERTIYPEEIGFSTIPKEEIYGGNSIEEASNIALNILQNKATTSQINVVVANTSFAIQCIDPTKSIDECKAIAIESIVSGNAYNVLKKITSN